MIQTLKHKAEGIGSSRIYHSRAPEIEQRDSEEAARDADQHYFVSLKTYNDQREWYLEDSVSLFDAVNAYSLAPKLITDFSLSHKEVVVKSDDPEYPVGSIVEEDVTPSGRLTLKHVLAEG